MLGKLPSSTSYGAVGREFSVSESTVYILSKVSLNRTHVKQGYGLTDSGGHVGAHENPVTKAHRNPSPSFPQGLWFHIH